MHCLDVVFFPIFIVNKDIIQIKNNKDIKFFCKDFIDVILEYYWSVNQPKRYYLILEVTVSGPESSLLLISFANSHLMVSIGEIKLGKPPYLPQLI